MGRLDDKVALITGGARGQGAAEAARFASEGATVYLTDVLADEGAETAKAIGGTFIEHDVTSLEQWAAVVDRVVGDQGGVDVARRDGRPEALVGRTHPGEVGRGQERHGGGHRELVHRRDDGLGVAGGAGVERADRGGAARGRDHQARLRQPQQRLAHGRAGDAEPLREVAVAELLARRERAVDDRVAQPHVHVVAQERPGQRRVRGYRHAIYCTLRRSRRQVFRSGTGSYCARRTLCA